MLCTISVSRSSRIIYLRLRHLLVGEDLGSSHNIGRIFRPRRSRLHISYNISYWPHIGFYQKQYGIWSFHIEIRLKCQPKESGNDLRLKELYPNLVSSLIEDVEIREILRTFYGPSLSVKSRILREAANR
jgi:hypothetical protein